MWFKSLVSDAHKWWKDILESRKSYSKNEFEVNVLSDCRIIKDDFLLKTVQVEDVCLSFACIIVSYLNLGTEDVEKIIQKFWTEVYTPHPSETTSEGAVKAECERARNKRNELAKIPIRETLEQVKNMQYWASQGSSKDDILLLCPICGWIFRGKLDDFLSSETWKCPECDTIHDRVNLLQEHT